MYLNKRSSKHSENNVYDLQTITRDGQVWSFFPNTTREWYKLPPEIAHAKSLQAFKTQVTKMNNNNNNFISRFNHVQSASIISKLNVGSIRMLIFVQGTFYKNKSRFYVQQARKPMFFVLRMAQNLCNLHCYTYIVTFS